MGQVHLEARDDFLCIRGVENSIMMTTLRGGDPQTAWWPLEDKVYQPYEQSGYWHSGSRFNARAILAACIYDAVETGDILYDHGKFEVVLPDGSLFAYLDELGEPHERIEHAKDDEEREPVEPEDHSQGDVLGLYDERQEF